MGNAPSLEGEDKSKYIEEQKKIIREQQEQIQRLASIAGSNVNEGMQFNTPNTVNKPKINPYNELNIGRNYDENSLKKAYLKRAMETHPDRGGTKEDFQRVTVSYKALMIKLNEEKESHEHNELRDNSSRYMNEQSNDNKMNVQYQDLSKNFNSNVFNKIYEETKVEDVYDDGYSGWMKKNETMEGDIQQNPSLTKDNFNDHFSKLKSEQVKKKGKQLTKYNKPMEDISYKNKSSIMILGQGKVDDFSGESGGLSYRDYKDAYTNTYLVEEEVGMNMNRPKDLKAAEQQRSNISYEMDEKGHREYSEQKLKEEQEEKLRLERLANYERKAFNIYDKVHQRMIG
tara:strand:- start:13232 stop:14260 length:1029 start_codon:yes stop_codon:yes gene_type:complete